MNADGDQKAHEAIFSVGPNHVIVNGKGRHACKYSATKYGSLLFIGVGGVLKEKEIAMM